MNQRYPTKVYKSAQLSMVVSTVDFVKTNQIC